MRGWVAGHPQIFSAGLCGASFEMPDQPLVVCHFGTSNLSALVDTGSMKSFISFDAFEQIEPKPALHTVSQQCFGINGQPLHVEGGVQAAFSFPCSNNVSYTGDFLVSRHLYKPLQCVLGWDFLTANGLSLVYRDNGAYYLTGRHGDTPLIPQDKCLDYPLPTKLNQCAGVAENGNILSPTLFHQSENKGPVPITLPASICVPGRTEIIVTGQVTKNYKDDLGMVSPINNESLPTGILAAYSVSQAESRKVLVRLMNSSNFDISLQAGQKISEFCPLVEPIAKSSAHNKCTPGPNLVCGSIIPEKLSLELEAAISPSLEKHERCLLLNTLLKYSDVFDESLGQTDVITHRIDTGDATPIKQSPRRLPYAFREEAKSQVRDMLDQGVIQPSTSPWASPIVLVKKKDGKYRFCVDYRKLNSVTVKDAHPLPRVDDLLDSLQGSIMFSTLDLRTGYWQINMDPADREKTAFTTPDGLWEFLRLPFGVSNGCATFQRAIEIVLSGLTYETCLCYFDDIIIPSNSLAQQCQRLSLVLGRFREYNLRVKASKCSFGADKVTYLGHVVSSEGVQTDPGKIEAVSKLLPPKTVEQVRSFLGLTGYYRKFIPNYAALSAPLVALTKKGVKFAWENKHNLAFCTLKDKLCKAPILAYPKFDRPFTLHTDASDIGIGAVLSQIDTSGKESVISYCSRSLSDREKNYSATEKEALAVIFAVEHFRVYLLGRQFTLVTDHSALQWLHTVEPKGRLARWVMTLQEYSFIIKHRPGIAHGNADGLSRLPSDEKDAPEAPVVDQSFGCATTMTPGYNLHQAQLNDPVIAKIIELKSAKLPKPPYFVWADNPSLRTFWHCWDSLFLSNGLLAKNLSTDHSLPRYAYVVPEALVDSVLYGIHCSPFSGHLGIRRTLHRAKERFFWPKMSVQISDFVRSCQTCAKNKTDNHLRKAPLRSIEVSEPFVFWAMDYMGPLPETSRGNKHLLVVMDHFSKWSEVFPTKDQKARTVAEVLVSKVFTRFGPPEIIHSDQGSNFESNLMKEICSLMGIHKSRTSAYHPQCDGLVERQNRTLQDILASYVSKYKDDWDLWVDLAVYSYNTSVHESTGFSPYELVFGRVARTPIEVDLGIPIKNPSTQHEYSQSVRRNLQDIVQIAGKSLEKSRLASQKQVDSKSKGNWVPLPVGRSVLLRRPKAWKFGGRWIGPYQIISQLGVNYKIRSKQGKDMIVHHNNVKACTFPFDQGKTIAPVREAEEMTFSENQDNPQVPGERPLQPRPARLRQNIGPPLRFGDFVTH